MEERMIRCIVAKQDVKMWNGKEYIRPDIGDEIHLPTHIATINAKDGVIRIIPPRK
jgi:hypothetical protein